MGKRKLIVEVCDAHNLIVKDSKGTSSPYVYLSFEGQRLKTKTVARDLHPQWNEKMEFSVNDPAAMASETLEVDVYNEMSDTAKRGKFLGRLRIGGSSIVKQGQESLIYYPLEKRSIFSRVKRELGLKVYFVDEEAEVTSNPELIQSQEATSSSSHPEDKAVEKKEEKAEKKKENKEEEKPEEPKEEVVRDVPVQEKSLAEEIQSEVENLGHSFPSISNEVPVDHVPPRYSNFNDPGEKISSTYDLVQQMQYMFVRVIKARDVDAGSPGGLYVKVKVGDHSVSTRDVIPKKSLNPEWNEVFAIAEENLNAPTLQILLKSGDSADASDGFLGALSFEVQEIPTRVHPDSPLAPQWYRLEDAQGRVNVEGDIMISVWLGTQADEAFQEAIQTYSGGFLRSKVYLSPKLWYLRVNVIEGRELRVLENGRYPEIFVKAQLGFQISTTRISMNKSSWNPFWNQDLLFVAAEPYEDVLSFSVENRVDPKEAQTVGWAKVSLNSIDKRLDHKLVTSRWLDLEDDKMEFKGRLHLRLCFDGGYHVLDEPVHLTSDLRPTCKELWHPCVGVLEVGILGAKNLVPTKTKDGKGTIDPYCVAKYGRKWIRTRTIVDSMNPKWNEQYTWEVYDPCTVFTLGVYDNESAGRVLGSENKDTIRMGKVRIRVSTLEIDRVYTNIYPLLMLRPNGLQKMGEVELAVRFSCYSLLNVLHLYSTPLLPTMHYLYPLGLGQQDALRQSAMKMVALRLSRSEPPLKEDLVQDILGTDSNLWSMRQSRINWLRFMNVLSTPIKAIIWINDIRKWKNPLTTVLVQVLMCILVCYPELILPMIFMAMFFMGLCHYRYRFKHQQPSSDLTEAHMFMLSPDELKEEFEFDTLSSSSVSGEALRMRYDRLRSLASRIQIILGDVASQGERLQALFSWRDPRATTIFILFCLFDAAVLYAIPFQVIVIILGLYFFRHPKLRHPLPSAPLNFFRRLPALSDLIL